MAVPALGRGIASGAWSIGAGLLIGLFVVAPLTYWYNFHRATRVMLTADFTRASAADLTAEWNGFRKLERDNSFLGEFSPVPAAARQFRAKLVAVADDVVERYRNGSSATLGDFDWGRARMCLAWARQLDPNDREAHGKLALCDGYLNLMQNPSLPKAQLSETDFEIAAADLPRSPDPHLGLARVYSAQGDFDNAVKEVKLSLAGAPDANKNTLENYVKRLQAKDDINR